MPKEQFMKMRVIIIIAGQSILIILLAVFALLKSVENRRYMELAQKEHKIAMEHEIVYVQQKKQLDIIAIELQKCQKEK